MTSTQTVGLSLKPSHYQEAFTCYAEGLWFEIHPENYMVGGGARLAWLETIRLSHPVALHGVSMSLAADCLTDKARLQRLAALAKRIEPMMISEHLAWSAWRGVYHPDLLPFPRTNESLDRIVRNISYAQETLGRPIAIENPAHYLRIDGHDWDEVDFLAELVKRTGCGLLLDVNNVFVAARNMNSSAEAYIDRIPAQAVMEIHLAGHRVDAELGNALLIDSHDEDVSPEVWDLYEKLVHRIGPCPTLIKRDGNIPEFSALLDERARAESILLSRSEEALR